MNINTKFLVDIPNFDNHGPIFKVEASSIDSIRLYLSTLIKREDIDLLKVIIMLATSHGKIIVEDQIQYFMLDIEQLRAAVNQTKDSKISLSKATLSKRLNSFIEYGVFDRKQISIAGKQGRLYEYTLQKIDEILARPLPKKQKPLTTHEGRDINYYKALKEKETDLLQSGVQLLSYKDSDGHAYSERLLNNVFFSAGRQSVRDSRNEKIVTHYPFQNEMIQITATAGGDSEIFSLEDQNTVLGIITMVVYTNENRLAKGLEVKNEYFLDLVDLCKICGLESVGSNRTTFRKSIDRLYFTNLNIACPPNSKFAEFFGLDSVYENGQRFNPDNMDFRFLWQRDSVSEIEDGLSGVRLPRKYRISLHPLIFSQLLDPEVWNTFVINPMLLKNRLKMITHIYFFAARNIARDPTRVLTFPIKTVQKQIMPSAIRFNDWQNALLTECRKFAEKNAQQWIDGHENTLDIYGYFVKFTPHMSHGYKITFWFNQADPILGKDGLIQKEGFKRLQPDFFTNSKSTDEISEGDFYEG
ncbi:hypothetical protein [Cellvibrio sp. QJXJ]|uniref:hypothetical protein n=1 Tax=Cellvibrio sp. QJXJ TaxID=2964606 RepID=UPI0021C26809|nr:hypothetical protein [Cellvibrio sp. QJXJ]UUA75170.1 hypothetical protein NNX04_22190 [Cellvibrio sp. QJXJ]